MVNSPFNLLMGKKHDYCLNLSMMFGSNKVFTNRIKAKF